MTSASRRRSNIWAMTRVKICGCRTIDEALAAADAGADFIGLMFAESRRRVGVEEASEIVRALGKPLAVGGEFPPAHRGSAPETRAWFDHGVEALTEMLGCKRPLTVGVFAGSPADEVNEIADAVGLDLVQLSGGEPWEMCLQLHRQAIKVVHIGAGDSPEQCLGRVRGGSAIAAMLDTGGAGTFGGTGKGFDIRIATAVANSLPVWLAGGLTPTNVGEAISKVRPWCVDVSTGVETDGGKDVAKVRAFLEAATGGKRP